MKKILAILLIVLTGFGTSCYKDLGNYDYHDINEVAIANGEQEYYVYKGNSLQITPDISSSQEAGESNYTYEWSILSATGREKTVIATTRNLDVVVDYAPGRYYLYYLVTDNASGLTWQQHFYLNVAVVLINEGYMVLSEVNDTARLDMVSYDLENSAFNVMPDVLRIVASNYFPQGKPVQVLCFPGKPVTKPTPVDQHGYAIFILTDQETYSINPEDFTCDPVKDNIKAYFQDDYAVPAGFKADAMYGHYGNAVIISNNKVYYYLYGGGVPMFLVYSAPSNVYASVTNNAAPFVCFNAWPQTGLNTQYLFDMDNKRFMSLTPTQRSWSPMADAPGFSFSNTQMDLVYMAANRYIMQTYGLPYDTDYAVMKDASGAHRVVVFSNGHCLSNTLTDIQNPTFFAPSPEQAGWLFYASGSKVFRCDISSGHSTEVLDVGNKEITLLKFQPFFQTNQADYGEWYKKLIVATYDQSGAEGSNGTLELYSVDPLLGVLTPYSSYSGLGKIKSVSYKERK